MPRTAQAARVPATIWTIGHSTRSIEDFLGLLTRFNIESVADVRRYPGSRNSPHYGQQSLQAALAARDMGYVWLSSLGGRRRASLDSPNTAWRSAAFRGYADYMAGAPFEQGLTQLLDLASRSRIALMCAEAVWWRCHRALIADALCVRGVKVVHILDAAHTTVHPMTPPARIVDGQLTYAAPQQHGLL